MNPRHGRGPRAWHRNGDGGHGTGPWQRLGVRRVQGQGEPMGRGRAGRPRKYSPVGREGIGTSTVVRGKGEGGRGADRDEHQDNQEDSRAPKILCPVWRQSIEDIKNIGGAPSPTPLHPHPSQVPPAAQVGGANPQTLGHWKGHQGQYGTRHQSSAGGRQVTTGATGGDETINEKRTERRQEEEREMHARAKRLKTWSSGGGILGVGDRGDHRHHWNIVH